MPLPTLTPEQQFARSKLIAQEFITTDAWEWLKTELRSKRADAILQLTSIEPTNDNLGQIARLQERVRLTDELLRKPYDLLGLPAPR